MAQSDRVRYVSTFRAPTEYERQLEEARRRAALAEALAQQEYQPMEGTAAPIPRAAPLVKALQGYLTAREGRKAREAAEEAKGMEADYAQRMLGRMEGGYTYQPNTALEQQMAKRPEETLDQYNQRIAATPFTAPAALVPEQIKVDEVTRQSQYRRAPEEVLGMASTSLGAAALKDRPVMAQRLAQMLETPKTAEFGTNVQYDVKNRAFIVNKAGEIRYLDGVEKPPEAPTTTQRDYEFARGQGYKGSFEDFRQAGTPKTTIDLGLKDTFRLEADLRGEVKDKLKDYDAVRGAYQKIENALETGAGDIAVVYAFAKLNDPTSVVRESEFATVAKSGSLGQRIKNLVEQAQTGKMNPELRENLRQQARQMYLTQQQQAESIASQYRELAKSYNLDPNKILSGININNLAAQKDDDVIKLPSRRPR